MAGMVSLSRGAVCRIGEVLQAARRDLVLPEDVGLSSNAVFLRVQEPKDHIPSSTSPNDQAGIRRPCERGFDCFSGLATGAAPLATLSPAATNQV